MLHEWLIKNRILLRFMKSPEYSRFRQIFPMAHERFYDDSLTMASAQEIYLNWPPGLKKPFVGIIQDHEICPRWTKYARFLNTNSLPYRILDFHSDRWLQEADQFDIIVGFVSSEDFYLKEMRRKFYVLEKYMGKSCYPSFDHIYLYENKILEAFISRAKGIPLVKTQIFYDKAEALAAIEKTNFPKVSKIDPGSGSMAVELVRNKAQARRIIQQAFSSRGRATHTLYFRQKNYVYFQDYIEYDGYDLRVILINDMAFGYYRKVPQGDFRASGMNIVEKRALPEEAVLLAWDINQIIKSPMLVVDMLHAFDGKYYVIEFSPVCQVDTPEQLHVDGVPGAYVINANRTLSFVPGKFWVHELALKEFFIRDYLPKLGVLTS